MGQRGSQNTLREMKMEAQHSKIYVTHKSSSKREVHSERGLPQETRKIPSKQSSLTHKTRKRVGTLHPPSDVYVRSFLCPFLYFNKTLLYKNS